MLRHLPIRRKLMVVILLTTCATLLLVHLIFFYREYLTFRRTTLQQMAVVGEILAANSTAALAFENETDAAEILSALKTAPYIEVAALYRNDGQPLARFPARVRDGRLPVAVGEDGFRYEGLALVGFAPVVQGGSRLGTLYLRGDTQYLQQDWMLNTAEIGFAVILAALIVAYAISKALQSWISRPIIALSEAAKAVSERRDLTVRAPGEGEDEVGRLSAAFNRMLVEMQAQDEEIRADIARRAQVEAEIQQLNADLERRVTERTAQLKTANDELESFSYSVSHDLRSPLRAVDGYSMALLEDCGPQVGEEGRRYIGVIRHEARRMATLIDDLLAFSRLSRQSMRSQSVDMQELVAGSLAELAQQGSHRAETKVGDLPACHGDAALLKQVWLNLLSNALKYSGKQAHPVVEVGAEELSGELVFFVRDNGTGFDMKYAGKLFGVFQRLHRADEYEGTGVGLAIVHRIVQRHGGRIWAESAPGHGATFFFTVAPPSTP